MLHIWQYFSNFTLDDFKNIVLAVVPLIALFWGPIKASQIANRQVAMQEDIAKRQIETQQQIAKRQIADSISSRRQVWIDELRKDASEYLALLALLEGLKRPAPNLCIVDQKKNFEETAAANARARELGTRINLRLNPLEDEHIILAQFLNSPALLNVETEPPPNETNEQKLSAWRAFDNARRAVVSQLQTILKHEWERVKRGEV